MNPIDTATGILNPGPAQGALPRNEMGKEEFLRLLVTQLSNQDPLQPLEAQEFAAQLAQFTSVEQLLNIQHTLEDGMQMYGLIAQSVNSGVAAGLVGREVEFASSSFTFDGSTPTEIGFALESAAGTVKITIRDAAGTPIKTLSVDATAVGTHFVEWDGMTEDGMPAPPGEYAFEVAADGEVAEPLQGLIRGRVDRVSFGANGINLWVNGKFYPLNAVNSVAE